VNGKHSSGSPIAVWGEIECHHRTRFQRQAVAPGFGHEYGRPLDGLLFARRQRVRIRRSAEDFESRAAGEPGRQILGAPNCG
jgi:hypothetical protein